LARAGDLALKKKKIFFVDATGRNLERRGNRRRVTWIAAAEMCWKFHFGGNKKKKKERKKKKKSFFFCRWRLSQP
jgi:hypothetical protein